MREIPKKNYLVLVAMVVAVVLLTFYLCDLYKKDHTNKYISVMSTTITSITAEDIDYYVAENSTVVLYISDKKDESLADFERDMMDLFVEYSLHPYFSYLDISIDSTNDLSRFERDYKVELNYENLPILVVINDGVVVGVFNEKNKDIDRVSIFLLQSGVIEDD